MEVRQNFEAVQFVRYIGNGSFFFLDEENARIEFFFVLRDSNIRRRSMLEDDRVRLDHRLDKDYKISKIPRCARCFKRSNENTECHALLDWDSDRQLESCHL